MRALLFLLLLLIPAVAQDKLGVVVGEKSKAVRRIIIPDNDKTLLQPGFYTGAGEQLLVFDRKVATDPDTIEVLVEQATGQKADSSRVAVVDGDGSVVSIIMADPEIDSVPDKMLVRSKDAGIGDKVDAQGAVTEKAPPKLKVIQP